MRGKRFYVNCKYRVDDNLVEWNDFAGNSEWIDVGEKVEKFDLPWCRTGHSVQGFSLGEKVNIVDFWNHRHFSVEWLYTAVSRCSRLDGICILRGKIGVEVDLKRKIKRYKKQDVIAGRGDGGDYIDEDYIHKLMRSGVCYWCKCDLDYSNFTVDRIDDNLGHVKGNCRLACGNCNRGHMNRVQENGELKLCNMMYKDEYCK